MTFDLQKAKELHLDMVKKFEMKASCDKIANMHERLITLEGFMIETLDFLHRMDAQKELRNDTR